MPDASKNAWTMHSSPTAVIAALLLLNVTPWAYGQATTDEVLQPDLEALFEAREFEGKDGDPLLYRLFTPGTYDRSKPYPVIVFCTGTVDEAMTTCVSFNAGTLEFSALS